MLKGHVFSKQLFENPIFALFINTFLNGINGVASDYKNAMSVSYSDSNVTVNSGAVCIQGRFLEEDTTTTIAAGTTSAYCRLVIEIDLDKENTESDFEQGYYKIVTGLNGYPELTQTNIIKNVSGIYQYELARFKTSSSGITDFQDMRTFLDFDSIYAQFREEIDEFKDEVKSEYENVLKQLEEELSAVEDGSEYLLKNNFAYIETSVALPDRFSEEQSATIHLNYPDRFNKDNCCVISLMSSIGADVVLANTAQVDLYKTRTITVILKDDYIEITAYKTDSIDLEADIKLILMKFSLD